jgi:cytoskeletal protein RodZ
MTGQTPRRRHSAAVYRRRRLVVLIAILTVVAAVAWLLIAQPWRGSATEVSPSPSATASASPSSDATLPVPTADPTPAAEGDAAADAGVVEGTAPSPSATPEAQPCSDGDVTVEAVVSQDSYAADQNPAFSIRLTNNGAECTLNVGTSAQSFTVTSGSDTWWRSTDCQSEPNDMVVLLQAGQTVTSATPLVWDRTRSAVGTCGDVTRQRAPGGGASYHLGVEIGGIASTTTAQFLLN